MSGTKESTKDRKERLANILTALRRKYPEAPLALHFESGFELLVAVILSAQCTDERVNRVTAELFKKYRSAQDYLNAPREQLEEEIKPTGFFRNKAKSLQGCCQMLVDEYKGRVPKDIDQLVKLPGVGRKTAAMVLGNAYSLQEGIAVDTHVSRVVQRVQLASAKTPDKIEQELMKMVPRDQWTWFSNASILHGRATCTAKKPKCGICPIEKWCRFPDKNL